MLPVIALVGRPNVGKSTLFNVLTGTRDAIVADVPGLTRDRQYGFGRVGPVPCVVIDTGGLVENPSGIEAQMRAQTEREVAEADRLLLLADGRAGLSPQDQFVARELRRSGKPRSEEHTSELQSRNDISYAVFCLKKKKTLHQKRRSITQMLKTKNVM